MKKFLALFIAVICSAAQVANAAILAEYNFTGSVNTSSDSDANSTASLFTDSDGLLNYAVGVGNGAPSVERTYASLPTLPGSGPNTSSDYYELTVSPLVGFELDLSSLSMDAQRTKVTGPGASDAHVTLAVFSSVDGFTTQIAPIPTLTANDGAFSPITVSLAAAAYQNLAAPITFRIYAFDASSSAAGGLHLDNVQVFGVSTIIPVAGPDVPEPASLVLWGLGSLGCCLAARRRRK